MELVPISGAVPEWAKGSGSGSSYVDGYGSGDGYGYGYGSEEYWLATIPAFAEGWTEAQRKRLAAVRKIGATIAFWRSDASGRACNGGKNEPVTIGTIEKTKGPLSLCEKGTLHATLIPPKWKGERYWIVALHGEVIGDETKYGCLEREILGEAL